MNDKPMTEDELVSYLGNKIDACLNNDGDEISEERSEALNYYLGDPYGNERDGYSQIVTRECFEAIEWALPSILRVFTSGDRVVTFEPVNEQDEEQAAQETDVVNHYLLKENDGFLTMYSWLKDALMFPVGYSKTWVERSESVTSETYRGLNVNELTELLGQEGVEPVEADSEVVQTQMGPMELYSVKIKRTEDKMELKDEPVPGEQVLVDSDLASLNIDKGRFVCHRVQKDYTTLVDEGYDRDILDDIGSDDGSTNDYERTNRLFYTDENEDDDSSTDKPNRLFWVHECVAKVDFDGDGLAESRIITMIGDKIFENEEGDYQPFSALATMPMSHKHAGLSLLSAVKDLQLIGSTLKRQMLDVVYAIGNRRKYVAGGALEDDGSTMDALLDKDAEIIPVRTPGMIQDEIIQSIIPEILPVIQNIGSDTQTRTGISPNLSLDANVLQQTTAQAFTGALEQASQRLELITRVFAETGIKQKMRKAHRLVRENMDKPKAIKLRGKWVDVDPSDWRERTNMTVNVGLGFNNRETQLQFLYQILGIQKEGMQFGIADPKGLFNTVEQIVQETGLKDVNRYFKDPSQQPPPPPPQPDPMVALTEKQIQVEAQKVQATQQKQQQDHQVAVQKLQAANQEMAAKLQIAQQEAQAKVQNTNQDTQLKGAQTEKVRSEATAQDIENGAIESGLGELLNGHESSATE